MALYTTVPTNYTSVLVADQTSTGGTSSPTMVGVNQVNAALEVKSTTGAFLICRMTQAQRDAMTTVVDGMLVYQTDNTPGLYLRSAGAWAAVANAGGDVAGPGASTDSAMALWNGTTGLVLKNSVLTVGSFGDINNVSGGASTVFRFDTFPAFEIESVANSVNYLRTTPAISGNPVSLNTESAGAVDANVGLNFGVRGNASYQFFGGAGFPAKIALFNAAATFETILVAPANIANNSFTLPASLPQINGATLVSDTSGVLSFNNVAILTTEIVLTAAQIRGMSAVPVQLLALPGDPDLAYVIHSAVLSTVYNATFVSPGAGMNIRIQYENVALAAGERAMPVIDETFITQTSSNMTVVPAGTGPVIPLVNARNQAVFISNDTGAITGGGTSTVKIVLYYSYADVS